MAGAFDHLKEPAAAKADRRSFLGAALATVTVAAVTGGTAALLLEEDPDPPAAIVSDSSPVAGPLATSAPDGDASYLRARLEALETENVNLRASLSAAQHQLPSSANVEAGNAGESGDEWRQRVEQANAQATELAGRLAAVEGLLTMYEELEALDLAEVAAGGVAALGGALGDLIDDVPIITEGLATGRKALDEFEAQVPLVEQGRYWLEGQVAILRSALDAAETALSNVLKVGGSFMQLLNRWFEDILKWLPFGIGEGALAVMSAVSELLDHVPETLDGLRDHVAGPLDVWLERDGNEIRLQRRLIKPVREEALDRADSTVTRVGSVNEVYEDQLQQPVTVLVERQRLIRAQIAQYRQDYGL